MSERLSPLDTMFLDLEQVDDGATMHFGAVLVFDPLPEGGTPDIDRVRKHLERRLHLLPRYRDQLSRPRASRLSWTTWESRPRASISRRTWGMRRCRRPAAPASCTNGSATSCRTGSIAGARCGRRCCWTAWKAAAGRS